MRLLIITILCFCCRQKTISQTLSNAIESTKTQLNNYFNNWPSQYSVSFDFKDGKIYEYSKNTGKASWAALADLEGAVIQTQWQRVILKCNGSKECIFSEYMQKNYDYSQFVKNYEAYNYEELAALINNFLNACRGNSPATTAAANKTTTSITQLAKVDDCMGSLQKQHEILMNGIAKMIENHKIGDAEKMRFQIFSKHATTALSNIKTVLASSCNQLNEKKKNETIAFTDKMSSFITELTNAETTWQQTPDAATKYDIDKKLTDAQTQCGKIILYVSGKNEVYNTSANECMAGLREKLISLKNVLSRLSDEVRRNVFYAAGFRDKMDSVKMLVSGMNGYQKYKRCEAIEKVGAFKYERALGDLLNYLNDIDAQRAKIVNNGTNTEFNDLKNKILFINSIINRSFNYGDDYGIFDNFCYEVIKIKQDNASALARRAEQEKKEKEEKLKNQVDCVACPKCSGSGTVQSTTVYTEKSEYTGKIKETGTTSSRLTTCSLCIGTGRAYKGKWGWVQCK